VTRLPATRLRIALGKTRRDLRHVLQTGRPLRQIANEPPPRGRLELRRSPLTVEVDELERVRERQVRKLPRSVLGQPQRPTLDRASETHLSVGVGGHVERMFSCRRAACRRCRSVDPDVSHADLAVPLGPSSRQSDRQRHAAFFVAVVPVPLHFGHSSTMRSALVRLGT
jgi:hypothetical protein